MNNDGLIKNTKNICGMEDCELRQTPTSVVAPLGNDYLDKEAKLQDEWEYASVIGILMYVVNNSRPDIAFVVNQCTRFTKTFKQSHEKSILHICKYLKGNSKKGKYKGLRIYYSKNMQVYCYAGADFTRIYGQE